MKNFLSVIFLVFVMLFSVGYVNATEYKVDWSGVEYATIIRDGKSKKVGTTEFDVTVQDPDFLSVGYCVNLDGTVRKNKWYDANLIAPTGKFEEAAWLFNEFQNEGKERDLQLAIWDVIYDNDYSLSSGTFSTSSTFPVAQNYLQSLSTLAPSEWALFKNTDLSKYMVLDAVRCDVQDVIVQNPVPLPAAFWLLGSGLLGIVGFRRYKKK